MHSVDELRTALRDALRRAMRARDRGTTMALRGALAAIDNAEAVPAAGHAPTVGGNGDQPRRQLGLRDAVEVVERELAERDDAIAFRRGVGDHDGADELAAQNAALRDVLTGAAPTGDAG